MTKLIALCCLALSMAGCAKSPIAVQKTNNEEINIEILFDFDGCRAYKFDAGDEVVYYVNCGKQTKTSWSETRTTGKTVYTVKKGSITVEEEEE